MYYLACKQIAKTLKNLAVILDKADRHATAKKFDSANYLSQRLAPDMFPLTRQVQTACDMAKAAAATFSNREVPRHEDTEKTIAELKQRINVTVAFVESVKEQDVTHLTSKTVLKVANPKNKAMHAADLVFMRTLPNFFFHVSIAYGLLRMAGVDIGKADFIGELPLIDAA